jgi:hypothetical protein
MTDDERQAIPIFHMTDFLINMIINKIAGAQLLFGGY